ncbi:hypothetical protein, partial [Burkholderia ubonensis]|uniref:hypothetical protein n=1 Tax=Burkholderia ubonensis TaxID=101571 RepID=UPI001E47DE52
ATRVSPANKFSNLSVTACPVMQGQVHIGSCKAAAPWPITLSAHPVRPSLRPIVLQSIRLLNIETRQ